jgi:TetR/AcrR family transcriptional regulator, transcriptional repressor for nem operon
MTESTDRRADTTRQQILRAASRQFAEHAYHDVGLDDILADAELTKGAMYFHFRSKHALAMAIIDEELTASTAAFNGLLARKLSGLETIVDYCYLIAVRDINEDTARAARYLVAAIGREERLQVRLFKQLIDSLVSVVRRAVAEGDIVDQGEPEDIGKLVGSMYLGLCQISSSDDPKQFLVDLENAWSLLLPGIVQPARLGYFRQFLRRRAGLAVSATSA